MVTARPKLLTADDLLELYSKGGPRRTDTRDAQ